MIENPTLEDLGLPDVLYDHDDSAEWHLNPPQVDIRVEIRKRELDGEMAHQDSANYPLETIVSKVEHGDLHAEPPEPEPAFECDDCGRTFETEHGLITHQGKAHPDDEPDEVEVEDDEPADEE